MRYHIVGKVVCRGSRYFISFPRRSSVRLFLGLFLASSLLVSCVSTKGTGDLASEISRKDSSLEAVDYYLDVVVPEMDRRGDALESGEGNPHKVAAWKVGESLASGDYDEQFSSRLPEAIEVFDRKGVSDDMGVAARIGDMEDEESLFRFIHELDRAGYEFSDPEIGAIESRLGELAMERDSSYDAVVEESDSASLVDDALQSIAAPSEDVEHFDVPVESAGSEDAATGTEWTDMSDLVYVLAKLDAPVDEPILTNFYIDIMLSIGIGRNVSQESVRLLTDDEYTRDLLNSTNEALRSGSLDVEEADVLISYVYLLLSSYMTDSEPMSRSEIDALVEKYGQKG